MFRHLIIIATTFVAGGSLAAQSNAQRTSYQPGLWESFNWGIHSITIPAVFLLGLVAGWWLREKKLAEERAREEVARQRAQSK